MNDQTRRPFHRPTLRPPEVLEADAEGVDPIEVAEAAHRTAALVVDRGRARRDDTELTARLVDLVATVGLSTVAQLWAERPARSLPGALWRLYLLHEWVLRQPTEVGRTFTVGADHAEVYRAVAGLAEPPDPVTLRRLTEEILTGVFTGDLAVALERAAAFCHVMAVGTADPASRDSDGTGEDTEGTGSRRGPRAARLRDTADDLLACARLWRSGDLT